MVEIDKHILDKADRKILAELDKNCRISSTQLARKARKSRQAVDYRIENLVKQGIILSFNASINPHKMGYKIYKIYLKLRNIPQEKQRLFSYLKSLGLVYWMGECSGTWDLIFGVYSKTDYEFYELKNDLMSKFKDLIVGEHGDSLIDVRQYPKMYFTNLHEEPVLFAGEIVKNELDELDYAILAEIVNNARIPITELAEKVNSTPIIVIGRMKNLEQKGIIIQYRIGADFNKLGLELYKAVLSLEKYTKEDEENLLEYISGLPNVHYFIRNIWNLEIELVVSNYQEYYKIIEGLKKEFPYVIKTVDTVLMITDEWTPGFKNLLKLNK